MKVALDQMIRKWAVCGSLGSGNLSFVDENLNYTLDTEEGFSFQIKADREWWVSPRWALGFALEYGGNEKSN